VLVAVALPVLAVGLLLVIFKVKLVGLGLLGLGGILAVLALVLVAMMWRMKLRAFAELDLMVLFLTLVMPFLAAIVLKAAGWQISQFNNPGQITLSLLWQGFLVLAPDWQKANMIERWPDRHHPESEVDVEAGLNALLARKDVCKGPVGIVALSRGPYYAIRLAAKRPQDIAAIVAYYGHFQDPNAPEPQQLFSVAPEVAQIGTPVLMLIGDADFEVRRMVNGRAFYSLWARGIPVELQMYPMARRAFDFRADASPEEKVATKHARQRARTWLATYLKVEPDGRCKR
jgi:carboxymethylenebutenolidase